MSAAFDRVIAALGERVVHRNGSTADARCPAHEDRNPSLRVFANDNGGCGVKCFRGCQTDEILARIGLRKRDLFDDTGSNGYRPMPPATVPQAKPPARSAATYPTVDVAAARCGARREHPDATLTIHHYRDTDGRPFGAILRFDYVQDGEPTKTFSQATVTREGTWTLRGGDKPWPLFGVDRLPSDGIVTVHEGEKAALAAEALGLVAVTSKGGKDGPTKTDWSPLAGRHVVIFPDNDDGGEKYAATVADILSRLTPPAAVRIARVPGLRKKGDVADLPIATDDELLEARRIVADAISEAKAPPTAIATTPGTNAAVPDGAANVSDPRTWNDTGLGRRLIAGGGGRIRYVIDRGTWVRWTGTHWQDDPTSSEPQRIGKAVSLALWDELHKVGQSATMPLVRFVMSAPNRRSIDAAVALAKSEPGAEVRSNEFDAHPDSLNVENGILDLRTRELRPHDPRELLTKLAPVKFDPAATCPRWLSFIDAVTCGDADLASFLQRSFGLALSADQSEQRLWIHHGEGSNGKGTALAVLNRVFGTYAGPAPVEILLSRRTDGDREIGVAKLVGKRLAFAQEADDGARLSEATVKSLTGSDPLTARYLYQNNFEVFPTWHIHLAVNDRPMIRGTDHGIWRRVTLVPWNHTFADGDKRPRLEVEEELLAEASGILNWLLDGYHEWRSGGLRPPPAVDGATEGYRAESDSVRAWMDDACIVEAGAETPATDLFSSYADWCRRAGYRGVSMTKFGRTLESMGHTKQRPKSGPLRDRVVRVGLRIVNTQAAHVHGDDLEDVFSSSSPMDRRF